MGDILIIIYLPADVGTLRPPPVILIVLDAELTVQVIEQATLLQVTPQSTSVEGTPTFVG